MGCMSDIAEPESLIPPSLDITRILPAVPPEILSTFPVMSWDCNALSALPSDVCTEESRSVFGIPVPGFWYAVPAFPSAVCTVEDMSVSGIPVFGFWYAESASEPCAAVAKSPDFLPESAMFPLESNAAKFPSVADTTLSTFPLMS